MARSVPHSNPSENMPTVVLLYGTGSPGQVKDFKFTDGSIRYFERILKNSFTYVLIDNIGTGKVRITYNRPELDISNYMDGAKTLRAGDSIYLEEDVWHIKVFFIESSTVELVLKSDKET